MREVFLTPHDNITNVQKRLCNRAWTGFGQCRLCGSFLDPQLEYGETCSTAEATRGHYACVHAVLGGLKLADLGITTEPRWPSSPCLASRRATTPSRHSNTAVCSKHRFQSQPPADVGEIASTQVETRNPDRSCSTESSHDTSSSADPFSTGITDRALHRWGLRSRRLRDRHGDTRRR